MSVTHEISVAEMTRRRDHRRELVTRATRELNAMTGALTAVEKNATVPLSRIASLEAQLKAQDAQLRAAHVETRRHATESGLLRDAMALLSMEEGE